MILGFILMGWLASKSFPVLTILCGLTPLLMGVTACLAYMFIDLERYQVERGYKAVHNPLKGQELALHLAEYGSQVRFPLLVAATVAMIGGFALLNQGLYESIGKEWYRVGDHKGQPSFVDFLSYGLINLFGIVDVLNLANNYSFLQVAYVHQTSGPPRRCSFAIEFSSPSFCCNRSSLHCARADCFRNHRRFLEPT